jgi:hypothetical protein
MSFFKICLEELFDHVSDNIRYNAISHRASKMEAQDFEKFMADYDSDRGSDKPIEIDHEAQIKMAQGL